MNKSYLFLTVFFLSISASAKLIKISNTGDSVQDSSKSWACVVDNKTQLMWEVKTNAKGLQDAQNTFTWFDGKSGTENGEYSRNCHWSEKCNTQKFITALNELNLCQSSDWRLPSESELNSLLVYNNNNPLINIQYFPNTQPKSYWTSLTHSQDPEVAIDVAFFYGGTNSSGKYFDSYVRGVSDVK